MIEWTTSQRHAIECAGRDMIVSAGAGSGKTTVLTHRIIEQIEKGASVSDFLVVTFTKASAADLREKLYNALSELSAAHPGEKRYRTQLFLLPSARISTIDSFCLELVRADFQTLGISPKARMMDANEEQMLASDVMEALIEECYRENTEEFSLLADTFSGAKDDEPLGKTMWKLYGQLCAYTDYFGWLESHEQQLRKDARLLSGGLFATLIGQGMRERMLLCYEEFIAAAEKLSEFTAMYGDGNLPEIAERLEEKLRFERDALRVSYAEHRASLLNSGSLPNMNAGKTDAEIKAYFVKERKRILDSRADFCEDFDFGDESVMQAHFLKTADILGAIRAFLMRFEKAFQKAKRESAVLSFSDAAHGALHLLERDGKPTPLCLSLRERTREILVDEYQDVSPLQDHIFELLSNGANRFMVGDVKQSIYRFRNAYPDIFLGYKNDFADYRADGTEKTARVFLRENFRSGKGVVDFVNLLFAGATGGTANEREYKGEELVFHKKTSLPPRPVTVALSLFPREKGAAAIAAEREAKYVASEIRHLVGKMDIEDKNGVRKVGYGDITLLFRNTATGLELYEKALREQGIPYTVVRKQSLFDRPSVQLALSILKAIDDPTDDISLFASMRSPAFGFTTQELYEIRLFSPKGPLIRAVRAFAEQENAPAEKARTFLRKLDNYRELAEGQQCHVFLWQLFSETGLLRFDGKEGRASLLKLYEYARGFEIGGYKGLSGLIAWLKAAKERGAATDDPDTAASVPDRVTLNTIHKSKGMEYPIVFLCRCQSLIKFSNASTDYTLLRKEGLFFRLRDYEKLTVTNTVLNRYALTQDRAAVISEELRILYVACTRAREKLYLVGTSLQSTYEKGNYNPLAPKSFLDMILCATWQKTAPCFEQIVIDDAELSDKTTPAAQPPEEAPTPFLSSEAEQALCFDYPYETAAIPQKVSVSELKKNGADTYASCYTRGQLLTPPAFLSENGGADAADRGTANHVFLQFCDFSLTEQNGVRPEAERLLAAGFFGKEQYDLLDFDGLNAFFASELYARMRKSRYLFREQRFSVRAPASLMGGSADETILVQGVIDCFFEEQDGTLTVVDYKTDRVSDPETLRARHEPQLAQYRFAVERMTGKKVGRTSLWSFAMKQEV